MTRRLWIAAILVGFIAACNGRHSSPIPNTGQNTQSFTSSTATPAPTPTPVPSPHQTMIPAAPEQVYVADNSGATSGPHAKHQPLYNATLQMNKAGAGMLCVLGSPTPVATVGPVSGGGAGCLFTPLPGPRGVAVDTSGNVYIADQRANVVYEVANGTHAGTVLGSGCPSSCFYNSPYGIAVDTKTQPHVYFSGFASGGGSAVFKYSTATGMHQTLAPPSGGWGTLGGVAVDQAGNVYVSDSSNGTIWKVPAPIASGTPSPTASLVPEGTFASNYGVAVDTHGNIYVADTNNDAVKEITFGTAGYSISCVPNTIPMSSCNSIGGGPGGAGFLKPHGVAVDSSGNILVADSNHSAVKLVTPSGKIYCVAHSIAMVNCDGSNYGPGAAGLFLPNAVVPIRPPSPSPSPTP